MEKSVIYTREIGNHNLNVESMHSPLGVECTEGSMHINLSGKCTVESMHRNLSAKCTVESMQNNPSAKCTVESTIIQVPNVLLHK